MFQLLDFAKSFINGVVPEDGTVADFTMGNGYDTLYLSGLVPKGKVYAFDIQQQAVDSTRKRLTENNVSNVVLIHDSHANSKNYIKEKINAGMFNLGYLPNGDKSIHTMRDSTVIAVKNAIEMLVPGGILVISVYPGHDEGTAEGNLLQDYLSSLDKKLYCAIHFHITNSPSAPYILAIEKYDKKENYQ